MTVQPVSDYRSNENDQIVYAANKIGRSKHKKVVFEAVYFGSKRVKTVREIAERIGLPRKRVLEEGKKLVTASLIHQTKHNDDTAYTKDGAYKGVWRNVLKLAGDKGKIQRIPTKTNPASQKEKTITLKIPTSNVKIKLITIDDISSFDKTRKIQGDGNSLAKMPESQFRKGILKILQEKKSLKDWGGEKNDIYTTKLKMNGKRYSAAFALKGPGQRAKRLTPKHMGKNGDQIQRLMASPAQAFFVQYWNEIDQSVVELMESLAIAKSYLEGRVIFFGIIDGEDSDRLVKAYPRAF